jgi:hypothetical protein
VKKSKLNNPHIRKEVVKRIAVGAAILASPRITGLLVRLLTITCDHAKFFHYAMEID